MVATNDGHYVRKTDAHAHDVLLAIGTKALVSEENRMRFPCDEFYVKSPDEMAAVLPESEYPGAIGNTNVVADLCDVQLPVGSKRVYQMPELPLPEGVTLAEQLRVDSYRGLMRRYAGVDEAFWRSYAAAAGVRDVASADLGAVLLGIARAGEASVQPQVEGENFPVTATRTSSGSWLPVVSTRPPEPSWSGSSTSSASSWPWGSPTTS